MNKQLQRLFVFACLLLAGLAWTTDVNAAFTDIKANIQNPGLSGNPTTFGVFVDGEGAVTFSESTGGANMVINAGSYNGSQHGWVNVVATVAVDGPVKVTVGGCRYNSNSTVTIKNTAGDETTFTAAADCWDKNAPDANVSSGNYMGGASTLTITCASYTPYIAVESIDVSSVEVSFSKGDVECEGTLLPTGGTFAKGDAFTIPANKTLYKDGYTLTGWKDGSGSIYTVGDQVTLEDNLNLTPVFSTNTKSLADRTEEVSLTWTFHPKFGCPTFNAEGSHNGTGIYVTQATVAGEVIDVKLDYDATNGKLNNVNRTDWTQINTGTKLTLPSCKGAVISAEFSGTTSATTIDGQSDYTPGTSISYTVASTAETVDMVVDAEAKYIGNLAVTLPVVEISSGESFDNVAGSINWPVGNEETPTIADDIASAVASATVSVGSDLTATVAQYFNKEMMKYRPGTKNAGNVESVMIEYRVKMAAGVKFTPSTVSFDAVKVGTDNAFTSWSYTADGVESTVTDIDKSTIVRNSNTTGTPALNHTVDVSEAGECEVFTFRYYISQTANDKDQCLGDIVITGTVDGVVQEVTTYALDVVASPAEGGSVSLYPADGEYEEGAEVKATATENFGYNFVNWTNSAGDVVSEDAQFMYTMPANAETLTANFEAVNTYELALTVDGTNDYMVIVSPEPTVVDGKNMYEAGTQVTLTANQYENLVAFASWSNGQTAAEITVTMNENVALTANYDQADIIAGWDFYKAGNSGRPADFASEDNITAAFTLTNGTSASSWLDKSTEKGGYESLKGAAVNWKTPVGDYYWQTKINAEQFRSINLQFQMLYNYNSYTTYNVEYSLDGTEWTKFGDITMEGAKSVASFSEALPEACDNQASLYIRWIPDYDSDVAGTTGNGNDGNAIAMVFFTGTQQMADDDVPPVLVSTVPANETTGTSASGKIVLTFDEKVQMAEGAKGFLNGDIELTPVVTGKTITFSYSGLSYSTSYEFSLEPGMVSDLSGNTYDEVISILFSIMDRPAIAKGLYDWVVPTDGTLEAAIAAANSRSDKSTRYRIFLMDGTYTLPKSATATIHSDDGNDYPSPITFLNASNVSIIGESTDGVIITNDLAEAPTYAGQYGNTSVYDGIGKSDVLQIDGSVTGTYFQNVTIKSGIDDGLGRNIAVQDKGSKTIYKDVCLWGYQDTWTSNNNNGLYYFENGMVRGRTDFLCGKGDAYFNEVDIQVCMNTGGYIAVPSTPAAKGWVFANCTIKGESSSLNGAYTLGRPWGSGTPIALWINTTMEVIPSAIGWSEMSNGWPARFAEYNSMTSSGSTVDLSGRKTVFGDGHANNPVLTEDEANAALDMAAMFGEWEPMLYTEQAPVPENVRLVGTTLSWNDSDYALLWAICKDGKVVDFTDDPTFEVDDATATWSVRAANEMGGLSEATEAVIPETISVTISESTYATFYYEDKGFDIPEGVEAYTATRTNEGIVLHAVDGIIPVGVPVLLHGEAGTYDFVRNDVSPMGALENDLIGSEEGGTYNEEGYKYYVLSWKDKNKNIDEVGFYWLSGSKGAYAKVKAHQAYMRAPKTEANADGYTFIFDDTTGITSVEQVTDSDTTVYTLSGIRMSGKNLPKGIYIIGGKKVMVK